MQTGCNAAARRYTAVMDIKFPLKSLLLALACGSFAVSCLAQWQWIDKDGRKVFSDRAPPADISPQNILRQPGARAATTTTKATTTTPVGPAAATPAASPSTGQASAPRPAGKDAQLEARKKQAEEEENKKKKAEVEVIAKARADNCARAKKGLATFQSGVRIAVVNVQGEREFMDDAGRATETKRLQGIADSDCKPQTGAVGQ